MAYANELINNYLTPIIRYFQELGIFDEVGREANVTRTLYTFAYNNWRTDLDFSVKKNSTLLTTGSEYTIDSEKGQITLTTAAESGDEIRGSYKFKYFNVNDLENFFELTIREINGRKPITAYELENSPKEWDAALVLGAYMKCIDRIAIELGTWQGGLIWRDPASFLAYLQSKRTSAQAEFDNLMKHLKRRAKIRPYGVSSGKYYTMQLVNEYNFRRYTIIGTS